MIRAFIRVVRVLATALGSNLKLKAQAPTALGSNPRLKAQVV